MEQRAGVPPEEFEVALETAISAPEAFGASFDAAPHAAALELGAGLDGDPAIAFRRTLGMFATGVTIITTRAGESVHGMTANAFTSVSLRPPLVLVSVDRRSRMSNLLHEGTRFGVNVLEAGQATLSDHFAGRPVPDASEPRFELVHDTPLVEGALAHLVARVVRSYWGGDHSLFLGQVEYAHYGEGEPLLFHGGRYERLIRDPRVFSALPQELLEPILALGVERTYEDGEAIMRRGEPGDELMLIVGGTVRVERPGRSLELGAGELIGEIEVLDPVGSRIADIHAVGRVRCVVVTREALLAALEADPRAAVGLIEILAARFRETA
jgi:flavin reductase (DIM6/NTAB) family NADH-FMN oxidoreductase RutF